MTIPEVVISFALALFALIGALTKYSYSADRKADEKALSDATKACERALADEAASRVLLSAEVSALRGTSQRNAEDIVRLQAHNESANDRMDRLFVALDKMNEKLDRVIEMWRKSSSGAIPRVDPR